MDNFSALASDGQGALASYTAFARHRFSLPKRSIGRTSARAGPACR